MMLFLCFEAHKMALECNSFSELQSAINEALEDTFCTRGKSLQLQYTFSGRVYSVSCENTFKTFRTLSANGTTAAALEVTQREPLILPVAKSAAMQGIRDGIHETWSSLQAVEGMVQEEKISPKKQTQTDVSPTRPSKGLVQLRETLQQLAPKAHGDLRTVPLEDENGHLLGTLGLRVDAGATTCADLRRHMKSVLVGKRPVSCIFFDNKSSGIRIDIEEDDDVALFFAAFKCGKSRCLGVEFS